MSTRRRRNRKTAKKGFGNAGKPKSNTAASANAEIAGGASSPHDWKRVALSLASNTAIVTAISYVALYLAMKAEAVHDGFPTSWVQISPPDLTRLIPSSILIFSILWYFVPFLASCRSMKSPSSWSAVVGMALCSALAVVTPGVVAAVLALVLGLIGAAALLYVACYAGLFVGFIQFAAYVCGRMKRQLPDDEKAACWARGVNSFLSLMLLSAWCVIVAFGSALFDFLGIRIATIESMAFVSVVSVILAYFLVPDMGEMAKKELLDPFVRRKGSMKVALISLTVLVSFFALWIGWNGLTEEQVVKHRETGEVFIIKAEYAGNDCVAVPAVCGDDNSYSAKDEGVFMKINLLDGYETVQD